MNPRPLLRSAALLGASLALAACQRDEPVRVYEVVVPPPARQEPAAPAGPGLSPAMAATGAMAAEPAQVAWTKPAGWQEQAATGMRTASFSIPGPGGIDADISVIRLAGDAANDLANVNLWRQQLGLPPVAQADLAKHLATEQLGDHVFRIFNEASEPPVPRAGAPGRILAAMATRGNATWVVRARGEARQIEAEQENFRAFLASLRLP